ncbi:transposase [Streptomyces sp. NPDC001401]|uniref:transposase n=1 Tax=Streptomyces sp. NPDC001401 TaxID=3364570 RepID=UPI0036B212F4
MPRDVGHREKWRLALDALDELAGWQLLPPVVVADAGYGQNADFRAALAELRRTRRGVAPPEDTYLVRDFRYSSTTRSVSSATDVSDVRLSKVISPC